MRLSGLRKGSESSETHRRVSWSVLRSLFDKSMIFLTDAFGPRHPGLVAFLGAWSTQHFTLDKQELKALKMTCNYGREEKILCKLDVLLVIQPGSVLALISLPGLHLGHRVV